MLFGTYKFLFLFLPVTVCGYYLLLKINRYSMEKVWLVAASLFFMRREAKRSFLILRAGSF